MKYKAILRDAIIYTDDYMDDEFNALVRNITDDLNRIGIDYPVSVLNEHNKKVLTLFPLDNLNKGGD